MSQAPRYKPKTSPDFICKAWIIVTNEKMLLIPNNNSEKNSMIRHHDAFKDSQQRQLRQTIHYSLVAFCVIGRSNRKLY